MTYQELKTQYSDNIDAIMTNNKVFWAFSTEQLEKGKKEIGILDNKDLASIGAGGFMPKANADKMFLEMAEEKKRYKKELKKAKEEKEKAILYELRNFEAFYTGDLEEVFQCFNGLYTKSDIIKVYKNNKKYANI
jgi:hypothetical protein